MAFRPCSRCRHLLRMQQQDRGGVLWPFDPVHVTTFLAGKSETEVAFMSFRPRSHRCHLPHMHGGGFCVVSSPFALPPPPLACKSETEVDFYVVSTPFMPPPPPSHARASRRWFYGLSTPFALPPPPSHATARWKWVFCRFDPFRIATTSLTCKSEMEVDFYVVSTPFAPPPPLSHARASQRWIFRGVQPPLPSHTTASRMWVFMAFRPRSHRYYLAFF
jgi:hypothetical protein